ncbi:Pre-mRNA-splicing factor cwf19, partial [Teratosphaeriaceae sp. CCFEE 6253]
MGLEDFEQSLAASRDTGESKERSHEERERKHRHHHRSHRHRDESRDRERRHKHKRRHERGDDDEVDRRQKKRLRSESPKPVDRAVKVFDSEDEDDEDGWVEKEAVAALVEKPAAADEGEGKTKMHRDAWMQEPSALEMEYVQSRKPKEAAGQFVSAKTNQEFQIPNPDHLADLQADLASDAQDEQQTERVEDEPAQHDVTYSFGDAGSSWRMTKLSAVYRQAKEGGRTVDEVAQERYGELRDFDDAREEERELDRRRMYGREYVGLVKPSGELFQERKMEAGSRREREEQEAKMEHDDLPQGEIVDQPAAPTALDRTALNKLKAQMLKAQLRHAPHAAQLESEHALAAAASSAHPMLPDTITLNPMDSRALTSGRAGEVVAAGTGKRARERGTVVENTEMSLDDMVRAEKRSKGGEGRAFAERIAKDGKFRDDLKYMDDNAANLSKNVVKSETQLKGQAIGEYGKMQAALASCPLCHHEDAATAEQRSPVAPVVSLATRVYLTLPTEPEIARGGVVVVPIQHHATLLDCDEDEWEE